MITPITAAHLHADLATWLRRLRDLKHTATRVQRDWPYPTSEDFLLAHARPFVYARLPAHVAPLTPRYCYHNAGVIVLGDPARYAYVEGLAVSGDLCVPLDHAWAVDRRTGVVVDPTWPERPGDNAVRAYLGVPLRADYLAYILATTDRVGLIDYWEDSWPILRGAHPIAMVLDPLDGTPIPAEGAAEDGPGTCRTPTHAR
jgi:hypothetical protein